MGYHGQNLAPTVCLTNTASLSCVILMVLPLQAVLPKNMQEDIAATFKVSGLFVFFLCG